MLSRTKRAAVRAVARRPVYRLMPPGGLRTYAALKYLSENASPEDVGRYVANLRRVPTRPLATAVVAARALLRAGVDDILEKTLAELARSHPGAAAADVLHADLHTFHGRYDTALHYAERAARFAPSSTAAAAQVVRLSYRVRPQAEAEAAAVAAVQRFPRSPEVLWQVAMHCANPAQYARVWATWQQSARADDLVRVVRQLTVAAARSGEVAAACDLYRQAVQLVLAGKRPPAGVVRTRLGGLGARRAIEDLVRALDGAGVPFFFAAGTALGLVREGRPLGADGDIDVGIFDADWDRERLIDVFTRDPRFDLDLHPQTQKVGLRHRGGAPIDIFRFYRDGDTVWHDGVFVRWRNSPFTVERRDVGGQLLPLPAEADRYLTENYGDWRTPNPAFDAFTDDAPNVEVTWPEYQRVHLLRRAYERLVAGDAEAARRELHRADEGALAGRIG